MADVETGPKLLKHRGRETLHEHVGELDMKDADLTDGDLFLGRSEDQSPHAWCVGAERGCWRGTRHLCCRSRRAYTVTEVPGVPAAAGATRWPRPHRW
jgi:hypothetical protein